MNTDDEERLRADVSVGNGTHALHARRGSTEIIGMITATGSGVCRIDINGFHVAIRRGNLKDDPIVLVAKMRDEITRLLPGAEFSTVLRAHGQAARGSS